MTRIADASTASSTTLPPPQTHDVTRHADGSCDLTVLASDTPETLYCAAYGDGVTGGAGQLATWLFAEHDGLPETDTRLHLPEHERMLSEASRAPQKVAEAALRCIKDGVSCGKVRKQHYQARAALADRAGRGLEAGKRGVGLGRTVHKVKPPAPPSDASRAALRATLEQFREDVLFTAAEMDTPSSWQALAARMLEGGLDLADLTHLNTADVEREVAMLLMRPRAGSKPNPDLARSVSASLRDGLTRAAGHRFFHEVQTAIRVTLEDVCARLRAGPDPTALRDGLRALGREAHGLVDSVAAKSPIGEAENTRALTQELLETLEQRIDVLSRMPDPATLVANYPGMVAAFGAARGIGIHGREPPPLAPVVDRLEASLAPLVPALSLKRGLERLLRRDLEVRGDNVIAVGLRARCDFDRVLDLTYALVSRAAIGALTVEANWESKDLPDALVDELKSQSNQGAVELLGWSAEQMLE